MVDMKKETVVITGATGFVARNLRKFLSQKHYQIISISRRDFKIFQNEKKIITQNLKDKKILNNVKNADVLFHLVGLGKQSVNSDFFTTNIEITSEIISICKSSKIKKIVFLSGLGVSKNSEISYFISKYIAEKSIIDSKLNYTIFRPSYIVGKDDYLTKFLKKQSRNNQMVIPGSGNYLIQPISVCDVVQVLEKSFHEKKFDKKIIDLVGPEKISYQKYVKIMAKKLNSKVSKMNIEKLLENSIRNNSDFGIDDIVLLFGNFTGNHHKLRNISGINFRKISELNSC